MKYFILLTDGMADSGSRTPMECAIKPNIDALAKKSELGLCRTVPPGMPPGSDVANLSVLGYAPAKYYTGRSPLEAAGMDIPMEEGDVSLRCNLVTLSGGGEYNSLRMEDYSAGDISTAEAEELIAALRPILPDSMELHCGVAYRHCLICRNSGESGLAALTPPHDITGQNISAYISHPECAALFDIMRKSRDILENHPVNTARKKDGKRPANSVWLWGAGTMPRLPLFKELYGLSGSIITAVDLLRGIGKLTGLETPSVPGATGYIDTDYEGKARAAVDALRGGSDFVYLHIEAPDECGHRFERENKIRAIEDIDSRVLPIIIDGLRELGRYRLLILPDHPTPLSLGTHTSDPVPYLLFESGGSLAGAESFTEASAACSGIFRESGTELMERFLQV